MRVAEYDDAWVTLGFHLDGLSETSTLVGTKDKFEGAQIVFSRRLRLAFPEQAVDQISVTIDDTGMNQGVARDRPTSTFSEDTVVIWFLLRSVTRIQKSGASSADPCSPSMRTNASGKRSRSNRLA